jgi:DNA-directed RNA polymerase specialized sigma24 family protein
MVLLEHSRKQVNESFEEGMLQQDSPAANTAKLRENDKVEAYLQCLEDCLADLPPKQRRLFVKYFQYDGQEKIDHHKKLAREFKMEITTLRTRVYRIKTSLEKSIEKCVRKKSL